MNGSSYRALYRQRPVIYHVGDIRLPFPVSLDMILLFFGYAALLLSLYAMVPPLKMLPVAPVEVILGGAALGAYLSVKLEPAGKTATMFLWGLASYAFRPRLTVAGRPIRPGREERLKQEFTITERLQATSKPANPFAFGAAGRAPQPPRPQEPVPAKPPLPAAPEPEKAPDPPAPPEPGVTQEDDSPLLWG